MNLKKFIARFHNPVSSLDAPQTERIALTLAGMYPRQWAHAATDEKRLELVNMVAPLVEAFDMLDEIEASMSPKGGG